MSSTDYHNPIELDPNDDCELTEEEKHFCRLQFLLEFYKIDCIVEEYAEENASSFLFQSGEDTIHRKVYDCGENYLVVLQ